MIEITETIYQTFSLDKETRNFLEEQKWQLKLPKSKIIRNMLQYFKDNPEELKKIKSGD
ncbi:MAG: hypothetical protein ACFFDF_19240 [Candidatus Odinarchaeota archaeon]